MDASGRNGDGKVSKPRCSKATLEHAISKRNTVNLKVVSEYKNLYLTYT